jgi:outer membrane protein assembly factor BamD (BamD/ComL family)
MIIRIVAAIVVLVAFCAVPAYAQSAAELYERALVRERAEGNLKGAMLLYEKIIKEFPAKRDVAAKALLQLGTGYEKLGQPEKAATYYDRLIRDYPDQTHMVSEAQSRKRNIDGLIQAAVSKSPTQSSK